MKKLTCEMCGSSELIKQDGVFVCQSCGTKYSVEEAKKMMFEIEGTVNVSGSTVKVDTSDRILKLYKSARDAAKSGNDSVAFKLYEDLLKEDSLNWEPMFFTTYYEASNCRVANMVSAILSVKNCLYSAIEKISQLFDVEFQEESIYAISTKTLQLCMRMFDTAVSIQRESTNTSISGYQRELQQCVDRITPAVKTAFELGDLIEKYWGEDEKYHEVIATCYETGINGLNRISSSAGNETKMLLEQYLEKAMKYDSSFQSTPSYQKANSAQNSGCYIATCIYGSYDCPQVWTLRRYRDDTLASTWYGRAFIHTYYAISPTLVKWFGERKWFKDMWKPTLDRMVESLQSKGVESTPYKDRNW